MINKLIKFLVTRGLVRWKFQSGRYYYYSGTRATFEKAFLYFLKPGKALDIGAGFGNETRELIRKGFKVVATDVNPEAVKYLRKLSKKKGRLTALEMSLPEMPEDSFDFIVCEMVLHFLNEKDTIQSVKKMQQATVKGGLNVISSYVESLSIREDPRLNGYFSYLIPPERLRMFYQGWEILSYEERSNKMGHPSARLIARKR